MLHITCYILHITCHMLHIIVTNIKEDIISKLQKLCSLPRSLRAVNLLPALFLKIVQAINCMSDLVPACNIFIEMPVIGFGIFYNAGIEFLF